MTDAADLLAAIIADPSNDLPRLIYADYLDERGEWERALFIRIQCQLAHDKPTPQQIAHAATLEIPERQVNWEPSIIGRLVRERQLLNPIYAKDGWPVGFAAYRRGFVEEITCSWDDWRHHADAIRVATPLKKVRLTTWNAVRFVLRNESNPGRTGHEHLDYPGIEFELPQINLQEAEARRQRALQNATDHLENLWWGPQTQNALEPVASPGARAHR